MIVEKDVELLLQIFGASAEIRAEGKFLKLKEEFTVDPKNSRATCLSRSEFGTSSLEGDVGRQREESNIDNEFHSRTELPSFQKPPVPLKGARNSLTLENNIKENQTKSKLFGSSFRRTGGLETKCNDVNPPIHNFLYINNPDGTIRWIIPTNQNQPYFLHLYNGSGWRGFLINNFYKIGFKLGLKKLICNGSFEVVGAIEMPKGNYAIFTGTKGENRKVIIASGAPNQPNGYLKIPLKGKAKRLTETEGTILKQLEKYSFKTLQIPKSKFEKGGVWVANVQPKKYRNATEIEPIHLNALTELFEETNRLQKLSDIPAWQEIKSDVESISTSDIQNNLSPSKVLKMKGLLHQLKDQFSDQTLISMGQGHGDFTPWNMFLSQEKLHLFDWELSERLPALYDLFHFVFQTGILVKKQTYSEIKTTIDEIVKQEAMQVFIQKNKIDVEQVYQFYLLRNCSYYLKRYVKQKDLHEQAHWLVDCWLEAMFKKSDSTKNKSSKIIVANNN